MALIQCDFRSNVLGLETSMNVILPEPKSAGSSAVPEEANRRYPTLYLLHGLFGNHTDWQRNTLIERYVAPLDLAVVMPEVHRSFYTDMAYGLRFWTFISEELPIIARSLFPLSKERKDTFVAGLSMGGYGAFKLALTCPDRYAAAAILSVPMDVLTIVNAMQGEEWQHELKTIFGDIGSLAGGKHDLYALAEQAAKSPGEKPRLYMWCGTEDPFYPSNVRFRHYAERIGLDITSEEGSGGHDFVAWNRQIQRVLEWLPLEP
jgi:putative tributyrin esterase